MPQFTLPLWFGPFAARPRLVFAAAGGAVVGAGALLAGLQPSTSAILGLDAASCSLIVSMLWSIIDRSSAEIRARAAADDEGRAIILTLVLVAAVAAIVAIALELSLAKGAHGAERALRVALAFATVAASWFMVHLIFAVHYAHGFYGRSSGRRWTPAGCGFPETRSPTTGTSCISR